MLTINGHPNEELGTKRLTSQLGRPDSIAKGAVECGSGLNNPMGSPPGDFWYYGCRPPGTTPLGLSYFTLRQNLQSA